MEIDLTMLGLTTEELQERVVAAIAQRVLEENDPFCGRNETEINKMLSACVKNAIAEKTDDLFRQHILPDITQRIDAMVFQQTNRWGEAAGKAVTVKEYLAKCCEEYLLQKVDKDGKTEGEGKYNWHAEGTRLAVAVAGEMRRHFKGVLDACVHDANKTLSAALLESVKTAISASIQNTKITVAQS